MPANTSSHVFLFLLPVLATVFSSRTCQPYSLLVPPEAALLRRNGDYLVVAHRGASSHLPEHTLGAYRLALELGADYVEPDVVATQDGKLIAMHTLDLNVTTNVVEVFGSTRDPWLSPTTQERKYWVYNFTYGEISQLKVKQRLPQFRSTAFDFSMGIPTLEEILDLVSDWNLFVLPQHLQKETEGSTGTSPHPALERYYAGVYAELKETQMLWKDANIDLVDLFYKHFDEFSGKWDHFLPCYEISTPSDFYRPPGLVIQSFEKDALQDFHARWLKEFSSGAPREAPEPPYVLLIDEKQCFDDEFWYNFSQHEAGNLIQGIGCNKLCIEHGDSLTVKKSREWNKVLHPWTERPERSFTLPSFATSLDEIEYLLCTVGVGGLFTESVDHVVTTIAAGCPNEKNCQANPSSGVQYLIWSILVASVVSFVIRELFCRRRHVAGAIPTSDGTYDLELT